MAEKKTNPPAVDPFAGLTEEARKHIEGIDTELDKAERGIEAMEEIGMDVSRDRERLAWGRKTRDVVLKWLKEEAGK